MNKRNAWNKLAAIATLSLLAGALALEAKASSEAPVGQLKLSQMSLESTQCPFNSVAKPSIGEEEQPAIQKRPSSKAISIAAE